MKREISKFKNHLFIIFISYKRMVSASLDSLAQVQAQSDITVIGFIALLCGLHRPKINGRYFYLVSRIVIFSGHLTFSGGYVLNSPCFSHVNCSCVFTCLAEINIFCRRNQGILDSKSWKRWVVLPVAGRGLCS